MMMLFPNLSNSTILMSTLKIMAVVLSPLPIRMKVKTLCEKLFWHIKNNKENKNEKFRIKQSTRFARKMVE